LMAITPLACDLMGWRGAGGDGAASTGAFFFMGGMLEIIGGVGEWILGNTFPFVVFCGYGGFWLTYGATLQPFYGAYIDYDPTDPNKAAMSPGFLASFAFFLLFMAVFSFINTICALRTNILFVWVFFSLTLCFVCLAGSDWVGAMGDMVAMHNLRVAAGASIFTTGLAGWYLFASSMLLAVDFPFNLPVGDLSGLMKGASQRGSNATNSDVEKQA